MEQRSQLRVSDWTGLNTRLSDLEIGPGASPSLNNIEFFKEGWAVRGGLGELNTSAIQSKPVVGLFDGFNNIIVVCGTEAGTMSTSGTYTQRKTGLTDSAATAHASYGGLDMFVNGSGNDAPQSWDGTTWQDLSGSPPNADHISVWRNYVWLTGLASPNEGEVRFCALETPTSWPSGHFLRPSKQEKGADLIASVPAPFPAEEDGTRLMVFGSDRIYHFDGFHKNLFQIYTVKNGVGAISPRGIVTAEDHIYWVDESGIWVSNNAGFNVNQISWPIQPTFDDLNKSRLSLCTAMHYRDKRQVWFGFSDTTATAHDKILVYNYGLSNPMQNARDPQSLHVWSSYDLALMSMAEVLISGEYVPWGGTSANTGFVYTLDSGTDDNGTDIAWKYRTKRNLFQGWSSPVILRKTVFTHDTENASVDVDLYVDTSRAAAKEDVLTFTATGTKLDEFLLDTDLLAEATVASTDLWYNRRLSAAQVELQGTDTQTRMYEMTMEVTPIRGTA